LPIERVMTAAKLAGAHEFILETTDGYNTIVGERGDSLSGGLRQRIDIARALITDPRILIFDEATSALDYESERIIQKNMKQIAKGRTVIIVAHRLSTVRRTDRIITIDRGRLIEDGTHLCHAPPASGRNLGSSLSWSLPWRLFGGGSRAVLSADQPLAVAYDYLCDLVHPNKGSNLALIVERDQGPTFDVDGPAKLWIMPEGSPPLVHEHENCRPARSRPWRCQSRTSIDLQIHLRRVPVLAPGDGLSAADPSRGSLMLQTVNSDPSQAPSGVTQILTHDLATTSSWNCRMASTVRSAKLKSIALTPSSRMAPRSSMISALPPENISRSPLSPSQAPRVHGDGPERRARRLRDRGPRL
jgi:hypothetical protein